MRNAAGSDARLEPVEPHGGPTPEEQPRGMLLGLSGAGERRTPVDARCEPLLAMAFHELRNPLCTAGHAVELLKRAAPGGEQAHRAVEVLERQLGLLGRLVDDLLDVTRMQRGKLRLERSALDFVEVARGALDDHRASFAARGVELGAQLPAGALWVQGDSGRLAQALGNLLGNAAKFTPSGGRVLLRLDADEGGRMACLRLRDSGVGFDPALREAIFEPFRQATPAASRTEGGLGLGLAIARGVIELHGGRIDAWSEGAGHGAEFAVQLPLAPPDPAAAPGPTGAL